MLDKKGAAFLGMQGPGAGLEGGCFLGGAGRRGWVGIGTSVSSSTSCCTVERRALPRGFGTASLERARCSQGCESSIELAML